MNKMQSRSAKTKLNAIAALFIGGGLASVSGIAGAHTVTDGTTLTNGDASQNTLIQLGYNRDYKAGSINVLQDSPNRVTQNRTLTGASTNINTASIPNASTYSNTGGVIQSSRWQTVTSNYGWIDGADTAPNDLFAAGCGGANQPACSGDNIKATTGAGANSHRVRSFRFDLVSESNVTIKVSGGDSPTSTTDIADLAPGFSVYSGIVPNLVHDYAPVPYDTNGDGRPDPFTQGYDPNVANSHNNSTGGAGTALYDRNGEKGVFYALKDYTMFNTQWERFNVAGVGDVNGDGTANQADVEAMAPEIGKINFLDSYLSGSTGVNGDGTNYAMWSGKLAAGIYSLVVGGTDASGLDPYYGSANGAIYDFNGDGTPEYVVDARARGVLAELTVAPVPIPAAVWLFGSALAGLGVFGRRKL